MSIHSRIVSRGFALPTILLASTLMMIVLLVSISAGSSVNVSMKEQYINQVAREAAESGVQRAVQCLRKSTTQNWSPTTPMWTGTNCTGVAARPASMQYLVGSEAGATVRTYYKVTGAALDSTGHVLVSVVGITELIRKSSGDVWNSYQSTLSSSVLIVPSFQEISGNDTHTCALASGHVYCWGSNAYGQLGNGTTSATVTTAPAEIQYANGMTKGTVTDIGTGNSFTCAVAQMKMYCWGDNAYGQLGQNNTTDSSMPVLINGGTMAGKEVLSISVGANQACAVARTAGDTTNASSRAYCWGWSLYGQMGNGSSSNALVPVNFTISGNPTVKMISTDDYHTCAATTATSANIYCSGMNSYGQLGKGSPLASDYKCPGAALWGTNVYCSLSPVLAQGTVSAAVTNIGVGSVHSCAMFSNSSVQCWGQNNYGQIGNNSTTVTPTPYTVTTGATMSVGDYNACVIATTGSMKCWGRNTDGQLGDGTTANRLVPTSVSTTSPSQLPVSAKFSYVTAADYHTCGIVGTTGSQQSVYCWGRNGHGQLGDGTTTNSVYPVQFDTSVFTPLVVLY